LFTTPAFAQRPEIFVQTGHAAVVSSVAVHGDLVASGNWDKTVKLWDAGTGRLLRTLTGHQGDVNALAFSPDGKLLASGGGDRTVRLWDVTTGAVSRVLAGHSEAVDSVAFSPDGKVLASGSSDGTMPHGERDGIVKLWDVATGRELITLRSPGPNVHTVAFVNQGKTLVSASLLKIIWWDAATGRPLTSLDVDEESKAVMSAAFSADGRVVATGNFDRKVRVWEMSKKEVQTFDLALPAMNSVFSTDVYVALSADGRRLASGSPDGLVRLWEVDTGRELHRFVHSQGENKQVTSLTFSDDGRLLVSGGWDSTVRLWDAAGGEELKSFRGHTSIVNAVAFNPDGKLLAEGNWNGEIKLWDFGTGREVRTLKGTTAPVLSLVFSPDGERLAADNGRIQVWDVASGRNTVTLKEGGLEGHCLAFSHDGKLLASAGALDRTIRVWDAATGQEVKSFPSGDLSTVSVAFSPDDRLLASGGGEGAVRVWDVASGRELLTLRKPFTDRPAYTEDDLKKSSEQRFAESLERQFGHSVNAVAFSPDGRTLVAGSGDGTISSWDARTGQELPAFGGHPKSVQSVVFSGDGSVLASGSRDGTVAVWDVRSGKLRHRLAGHSGDVTSVSLSADGKMLASGSWDGSVKLWDPAAGKELVSLVAVDERDWLAVTPDGLFDGSPRAWGQILWRFTRNTFDVVPVEAFYDEFYHPGLLEEIMSGRRPAAPRGGDISRKDRRQIRVGVRAPDVVNSAAPVTSRDLKVEVEVEESPAGPDIFDGKRILPPSGAKDIRLFRNGTLVRIWHGEWGTQDGCRLQPQTSPQGARRVLCATTVPVVAGENRFTAYAFNFDNVKSLDGELSVTGGIPKRAGTLYILAVGVGEYENKDFDLRYAEPDAQEFGAELKKQQDGLQSYRVEVTPLYNERATKKNVLDELAALAKKAQPEDAVFVYFSGHGMAYGDRFYLIPHDLGYMGSREELDEAGLSALVSHGISDVELNDAFEGMDAGRLLLVLDACHSGQALEAEEKRRGPMNSKGLAQLAYEKGMYVLAAAQSYQAANENGRLKHGYLTYALVEEGLKGGLADDEPKDGRIAIREWLDYAAARVPLIYEEQKKEDEEMAGIHLGSQSQRGMRLKADEAQRPRVFYRVDLEEQQMLVARPTAPSRGP
jgi:WD40 repeat protein